MKSFENTDQLWITDRGNLSAGKRENTVMAVYDHCINTHDYFPTDGIPCNDDVCFGTEWNMENDEIHMYYWCDGKSEFERSLTKKEEIFFRELMEKYSLKLYGCNIHELFCGDPDKNAGFEAKMTIWAQKIKDCIGQEPIVEIRSIINRDEHIQRYFSGIDNEGELTKVEFLASFQGEEEDQEDVKIFFEGEF